MRYEGNIYRPPGEWKSYLLQATVGCSHNTCTFCSMYKDKSFRIRDIDEVLEDIKMAKEYYGSVSRVFLCDGDAIALPQDYLLRVLSVLYETFPTLERVTTYAGPQSTLDKSASELKQLSDAGLGRAYLGIETGDGALLRKIGKGVNAEGMLEAGVRLRQSGIDLWGIVMIGIAGGGDAYIRNADMTAELINKMNPQHFSALTYMPIEGTPMYRDIQQGKFKIQSSREALMETRRLVAGINLNGIHFTSNHASNHVPIKGTLSQDRDTIIKLLDDAIADNVTKPEQFRRL